MIAFFGREATGEGQQVDVSMQETNIQLLQSVPEMWDLAKYNYHGLALCGWQALGWGVS